MLIGLFSQQAIYDMHQLQKVYPTERVGNYEGGEFLCKQDGTLMRELDGQPPTRLSCLDHLHNDTIGGAEGALTADAFADVLIAQLDLTKKSHGQSCVDDIKDIDLLGCEGGLRWTDNQGITHESIAEVLARKLNNAGYGHIKVHTLTLEFIGDPVVTNTRLYGQPTFEFYGFTAAGIKLLNDAGSARQTARDACDRHAHHWNYVNADLQRLSAIPYANRTPQDIELHAKATKWLATAQDDAAINLAQRELANAEYDEIFRANRRPPDGIIKGRDIREVLADPRNIIAPPAPPKIEAEPIQYDKVPLETARRYVEHFNLYLQIDSDIKLTPTPQDAQYVAIDASDPEMMRLFKYYIERQYQPPEATPPTATPATPARTDETIIPPEPQAVTTTAKENISTMKAALKEMRETSVSSPEPIAESSTQLSI